MCILYYISYKYILSKQSYLHINLHWLCKLKKELASEEKRFFSHDVAILLQRQFIVEVEGVQLLFWLPEDLEHVYDVM